MGSSQMERALFIADGWKKQRMDNFGCSLLIEGNILLIDRLVR